MRMFGRSLKGTFQIKTFHVVLLFLECVGLLVRAAIHSSRKYS